MKNVNYEFWENVENDCENLYTEITNLNDEKIELDRRTMPPGEERTPYHPLQIWCADMWAVLWNAGKLGHNTISDTRFDFSWATGNLEEYQRCNIMHNAGVTAVTTDLFYKSNYINKLPYNDVLDIKDTSGSFMYWKEIQKTAKKSVLINKEDNVEIIIEQPKIIKSNPIKDAFEKYKIHQLQLDPFGVCNAKCWFCPVKYNPSHNEHREVMSPELLEKIISNLINEREKPDGLVAKSFGGFYTAHYNEILLYPHFEELLQICQKYKLCFMVLSNGIPFTPKTVDLINKYKGVVNGICLNIPAFDAETWSKRSGNSIKLYDKLISNINYAINNLPEMVTNKSFSIQVNGANENSFGDKGGWLTKGIDFPSDMDLNPETGELYTTEFDAQENQTLADEAAIRNDAQQFQNSVSGLSAAKLNTASQATQQDANNFKAKEDWRVRLSLAPGADYLYAANPAGLLPEPLKHRQAGARFAAAAPSRAKTTRPGHAQGKRGGRVNPDEKGRGDRGLQRRLDDGS
jgi:hypothetical protein